MVSYGDFEWLRENVEIGGLVAASWTLTYLMGALSKVSKAAVVVRCD
jgi:hypothetical protein